MDNLQIKGISTGNFNNEAHEHRGWVVGHFMGELSPLRTQDLEIKWEKHKAGETKKVAAKNIKAKSLSILIRGNVTLIFDNNEITLKREGDYCFFDAGVSHSWSVNEDSLSITVRWPSLPEDQAAS